MIAQRLQKLQKAARIPYENLSPRHRRFKKAWQSINAIEGYLVPGQEWWLYQTAYDLKDGAVILEIGSFQGRSTACLALGCKGTTKRVYAVDTFNGNDVDFHQRNFFEQFKANLERVDLWSYVIPMVGLSTKVAEQWDKPIDLIFIDGSHEYNDVVADFQNFYPFVKPGGIIAFHDVVDSWPGSLKCWVNVAAPRLTNTGTCSTIAFGMKPSSGRR